MLRSQSGLSRRPQSGPRGLLDVDDEQSGRAHGFEDCHSGIPMASLEETLAEIES